MGKPHHGVIVTILLAVVVMSATTPTHAGEEVFVVSSSQSGDTNFLASNGDGTFGNGASRKQQILLRAREFDFDVSWDMSFGNGLGDFDGDGDMDYVMAIGYGSGKIYIYEKIGAGNQFDRPYYVDNWGEEEGRYPMDIAVADFDGDDDLDFVLTLGKSMACGLYLNNGMFEFKSRLLPDTAPQVSFGADAADFDNDGDADFIVAAGSDGVFYVNLNDNEFPGTFSTYTFDSYTGGAASGVAAADFTGDGIVDIVAGAPGFLDLYEGSGDGKSFSFIASYAQPVNPESAIDNYDFNGDGNPDLVVANYGDDESGVAVLLSRGDMNHPDGLFLPPAIYRGGTGSTLNAISGPPYTPISNQAPVAVIEPEYLEVTAGEEIQFDGSNSFDEDGQIVSYEWDFGEFQTNAGADTAVKVQQAASKSRVKGVKPSHTYYASGTFRVTLWVTDDQGATTDIQAEVVVNPVQARVRFYPGRLYLGSKGKYLWAKITFPSGFDARNVDESSLCIIPDNAPAIFAYQKQRHNFFDKLFNKFRKRKKSITVRFDRQAVLATLDCPPERKTVLKIQGEIDHNNRWTEFVSTGAIRTKMRRRHKCSGEQPVERLVLTSLCSDDPRSQRRWRIRNPNRFKVKVLWDVYQTDQTGSLTVPAGDTTFLTRTVAGSNTTKIKWQDRSGRWLEAVKASGSQACSAF